MTSPSVSFWSSPRAARLAGCVIFAGALVAYHNSFSVPFVFDDNSSIRDNPSLRHCLTAFSPPNEHGLTVSGRPLLNATFALNYALSGTGVWSYHALNLLIHALSGCVCFGIVRRSLLTAPLAPRFGKDAGVIALVSAVVWTVHPLQTESVTYIVQRAESLMALCYLLTLWCFIRAVDGQRETSRQWKVLALLSCLAGMATKEVMATAPLLVVLYDRTFVAGSWREVWRRRKGIHLALASTWLLLATLVLATGNRGGTAGIGTAISSFDYARTQIVAITHYLRLAFWPHPLVFDYGRPIFTKFEALWLPALIFFPLLVASVVGAWRGKEWGYCGVFFFGVLAPTSSVVPVVTQTMNEHRVYLSLAALIVLVSTTLYAWLGRKSLWGGAAVAVIFLGLTFLRNRDYHTEISIWEDTIKKYPSNDRAFAAAGAIYQKEGRLPEALDALQNAVRLNPESAEAINNLGNVWMKMARWDEAQRCFERALQLKPDDAYQLNNLGNAWLQQGHAREAMANLEAAIRLKPDFQEARYNLANIFAQNGRFAEAAPHYAALLKTQPDDAEAHSNYGNVLLALDRFDEGVNELVRAVELRPDDAEMRNNLGVAYAQRGQFTAALKQFEEAVRLKPDFQPARDNAARATRSLRGN